MICPYCDSDNSICIDSRQGQESRRRRYSCGNCGKRFSTREIWVSSKDFTILKVEGKIKDIQEVR